MKFSVIIAVFNGEKYINRCVTHFLAAKSINLEVIVVNDGSTDGTLNELKKLEADKRLIIKSQTNKGVSCARNLGLDNCHGDWVFFCDADDWVNTVPFENAVNKLSSVPDDCNICVIASNFVFTHQNQIHKTEIRHISNYGFLKGANFRLASWNYFFRMSNIINNGIRYPEGVICAEDQNFNLKCICSSPQIYTLDDVVYNYDQTNINSASKKKHHGYWIKSRLLAVEDLIIYCKRNSIDVRILQNQIERMYESYLYDFTTDISLKEKMRFYKFHYNNLVKSYPFLLSKMKFRIGNLCFPLCNLLFYLHKKNKG